MKLSEITMVDLLKGDIATQQIKTAQGKRLFSEEDFWGNQEKEGLYYSYENDEEGYSVAMDGWYDYSNDPTLHKHGVSTATWVNESFFSRGNAVQSGMYVIQGYAGCGKTTFVQHAIKSAQSRGMPVSYYDFYESRIQGVAEDRYIGNVIRAQFVDRMAKMLCEDDGMNIFSKFVDLLSSNLGNIYHEMYNFIAMFTNDSSYSLSHYVSELYMHRKDPCVSKCKKEFRAKFLSELSGYAINIFNMAEEDYQYYDPMNNSLLACWVTLDLLWCYASVIVRAQENKNYLIVYDNLDIIDNHKVIAEFISVVGNLLRKFVEEQESSEWCIKLVFTVRKITHASLGSFHEVQRGDMGGMLPRISFLDISNLYVPERVLVHKATYLRGNMQKFIPPENANYQSIMDALKAIIDIPPSVYKDLRFSELLNHNVRACATLLNSVLKRGSETGWISGVPENMLSHIWLFILCKELMSGGIWTSLRFNSEAARSWQYPSNLSRMILTILLNRRIDNRLGKIGADTFDVSLGELVDLLEDIPSIQTDAKKDMNSFVAPMILKQEQRYTGAILRDIAAMLLRNKCSDEFDIWRRPLYYTVNTFPLISHEQVVEELQQQLQEAKKDKYVKFCITDEGAVFIDKIATHFEFYSVRYNFERAMPLMLVTDTNKLHQLLSRVFKEVSNCVDREVWLMNYTTANRNISREDYYELPYHPYTDASEYFSVDSSPNRKASHSHQLNVVRTIYHHIDYLNECREMLDCLPINEEDRIQLRKVYFEYIGKYMDLYGVKVYDLLAGTSAAYNNRVWLDLKYLCLLTKSGIEKIDGLPIVISRRCAISRKEQASYPKEYRISENMLRKEALHPEKCTEK